MIMTQHTVVMVANEEEVCCAVSHSRTAVGTKPQTIHPREIQEVTRLNDVISSDLFL